MYFCLLFSIIKLKYIYIMKKFSLILGVLGLIICTISAQNSTYKSGVVLKKYFFDYQTTNGGNFANFKDYRHGYEIGYQRVLKDNLALNIPFRYGVVDSHIDSITNTKKQLFSLDAQLQYFLTDNTNRFLPYIVGGLGGVYEIDGIFNAQIPVGIGFHIRLVDQAFITWQSEFRYALTDNRNNFQHGLGFTYLIGNKQEVKKDDLTKDTDGDGIPDHLDLCPYEFGAPEHNGCPDKDGDGVPDYKDKCPEIAGLKEFDGCPDTDGDGIPDNLDECPNVAGPKSNKGCPETKKADRDGDGVPDDEDECPDQPGPASTNGCPDRDGDGVPDHKDKCPDKPGLKIYEGCPDTDGDGIPDHRDKCPNIAGTVANDGCPEIKQEDKKTLEIAMQAVQFETGSANLKTESFRVLNQIVDIMERYPDFVMEISGHTDNVGRPSFNQSLSERRAKSCYDYLVQRGISPNRLSHAGFGDSRPVSTNANEKGRSLNRRVEFNLIPRQ